MFLLDQVVRRPRRGGRRPALTAMSLVAVLLMIKKAGQHRAMIAEHRAAQISPLTAPASAAAMGVPLARRPLKGDIMWVVLKRDERLATWPKRCRGTRKRSMSARIHLACSDASRISERKCVLASRSLSARRATNPHPHDPHYDATYPSSDSSAGTRARRVPIR